ncbi:TPA: asparagine synthase, partial [Candidatus Bathyarchaeota archaeon]|nr:asparagine synthase [Candidatus Bathyarchaeota archaeon]
DVNRVTVGFSGGIDSSLIALLSSRFVDTELVTVGMGGAEIEHAREAVDLLGLRLIAKVHTVDDLREAIPRVLWLIEEPNLMKLGVAIPFYWASREGAARRRRVMLSGQGSDEMYGGYARYLRIYRDEGPDAVDRAMLSDVVRAYEVNYERDNKACACNKVEVRHPFADWGVVGFSLSLPVGFKIASGEDLLRKRIVRRVGEMVGLPKRIVDRPKRAVQYSSGVDRAIRRVARGMGLRPQEYVLRVFHEVFGFKRPA